jgi:hypothetical protein
MLFCYFLFNYRLNQNVAMWHKQETSRQLFIASLKHHIVHKCDVSFINANFKTKSCRNAIKGGINIHLRPPVRRRELSRLATGPQLCSERASQQLFGAFRTCSTILQSLPHPLPMHASSHRYEFF